MKTILVTGGCGFIGSHTVCELYKNNYKVIIIDNFINSDRSVIDNMEKIIGNELVVYEFDIAEKDKLDNVFKIHNISGVIHFAALKSVSESIQYPLQYYRNNVMATISLLEVMKKYNCRNIIFSSSATVYGSSKSPLMEDDQTGKGITNPYGQTKYMMENILEDFATSLNNECSIIVLRYFNPVGAHKSGLIGEDPKNIPTNLMPFILKVALQNNNNIFISKSFEELKIFGKFYNTKDGTCIRDYIHVVDLAKAHVLALNPLKQSKKGYNVYNIGTGKGTSVLELVEKFKEVNNVKLPYTYSERREGDLEEVYCNADRAYEELGWVAELTIEDMCRDSMNFIRRKSIL